MLNSASLPAVIASRKFAQNAKRRKSLVNAQDALMIGKTPRAVAVTNARPTTPRTANTAKDTFSTIMCHHFVW